MSLLSKPTRLKKPIRPVKTPDEMEQLNKLIEHTVKRNETPRVRPPSVKVQNIRVRIKRPHA